LPSLNKSNTLAVMVIAVVVVAVVVPVVAVAVPVATDLLALIE